MPKHQPRHDEATLATRQDVASGLLNWVQDRPVHVEHVVSRKKRGRAKPAMQLQMTSMIDVIFLLLIYFVVTAAFVEDEGVLTSKLPEKGQSEVSAPTIELSSELTIELLAVLEDPQAVKIMADGRQAVGFTELYQTLAGLQDDPAAGRAGLFAVDDPVRIQPERGVRWQHVVNALNAAVRAGYTNVQFVPADDGGR